jgi:hypothetical protein
VAGGLHPEIATKYFRYVERERLLPQYRPKKNEVNVYTDMDQHALKKSQLAPPI